MSHERRILSEIRMISDVIPHEEPDRYDACSRLDQIWGLANDALELPDELEYQCQRAGVQATAIGMARLHLEAGRNGSALEVLDKAAERLHQMLWDGLVARGNDPGRVDLLIGKRDREAPIDYSKYPPGHAPGTPM